MAVGTLVIATIGSHVTAHVLAAHGVHTLGFFLDPTVGAIGVDEVSRMLTKAQLFTAGVVVGIGGLMASIAGVLRQLGLREEAMKRWKDVLWGTAMALTGPACVFLIATIVKFIVAGVGVHA